MVPCEKYSTSFMVREMQIKYIDIAFLTSGWENAKI